MSKRTTGMVGAFVLAIVLAVFSGSALAGNGNGNGNASTAPGNSGNAPGHNKGSTQASVSGSASQNSSAQAGMKPTNSTSKNTTCTTGGGGGSAATCVPSSSDTAAAQVGTKDASKRYGNGQTAAQIATSNGVAAGATVLGPGNSQPHKVQACGKANGHWVDVHAVKHVNSAACSTSTQTTMTSQNGTTSVTSSTTVTATTHGNGVAAGQSTGGVLGTTATAGKSGNAPFGGVLGALTTVAHGTLPFTGYPVWVALAVALALIAGGLGLRRASRAGV